MDKRTALTLLFDRPKEPIFKEKGENNVIFDVPKSFITERFQGVAPQVQSRFGDENSEHVTVRQTGANPDVSQFIRDLPRDAPFSLWVPKHSKIAAKLIDLFMAPKTVDDLLATASFVRDRINPQLFNYAYSVALLHRKDTHGVDIPSFAETFPDKFVDSRILKDAREDLSVTPISSRSPLVIPIDFTASDLDPEHKLWYFREDIGINLHHWHWHLVYPFDNETLVNKDRRGELFYYMHQQIVARYNSERLSNGMPAVERFSNFRAPIKEGYFPKLDSLVANRSWPPRPDGVTPSSIRRTADGLNLDIASMERFRDRIIEAINNGFAVDNQGQRIPLDNEKGIDHLGNMMESSIISPSRSTYGNLHNDMHNLISYSHDPDHRHLENFGVIGDSTTAMRDPVFYRVHNYVDDIFHLHKTRLTPYSQQQLTFPGVSITAVQVMQAQGQANRLNTHWQQSDVNLTRGLDFAPRGDVFARFTHLQHVPFTTTMSINNTSGAVRRGMARIFIAPKVGFTRQTLNFNQQRLMMIEIDKFVVQLNPGQNVINRRSSQSTVTIPFEQTFRNLDRGRPAPGTQQLLEYEVCGCGWPNHMLIPKGTPSGMKYDLFAMVSDYELDRVEQDLVGACTEAASFCGIRDRKYPDLRPMGYPFDRLGRQGTNMLNSFLTPNMRTQEISITFNDRIILKRN